MTKTKKSLLMSAISLLLCISMLIGSTFAWFTDEIVSAGNKIQAGTLRVDLELLDKTTGTWHSLKETKAPIFNYDKWEPGYIDVKVLKIENEGSLALKWVAKFYSETELSILSDVIDVYVRTSDSEFGYPADRSLYGYTCVGNLRTFINSIEETTRGTLKAKEVSYLGIALKMREEAGNEYQGLSLGGAFDIRIFATQFTHESDSFGDNYDKDATFDDFADTSILATQTKTLESGADSVEFSLANKDLSIAKVTVPADAIADPAKPVTVTFEGIKRQITGENIEGYAYDIKVTNLKSNLTGDQLVTVVVEAPKALAAMQAYHNGVLIEDAVYDEVAGTITFKTASFSPYDFTSNVEKVSSLEDLRKVLQKDNYTAKLMADIEVDLTKGSGAARVDAHAYVGSKTYYNGVMIQGKNVGLDLNGHNITAFCGDQYNSNSDVGALFFVGKEGSLNITNTGAVSTGFIKMRSSIYAVWAPFADPSYVDIYGGAFIGDSYAGDPIGTPVDSNGNYDPANGTMKNENSNRALIYAGFGGNMNVYGGYFLYNNTPNDTKDRNNGAFNAKDFYSEEEAAEKGPLLTIHDGVYMINKEYRQNPANTSQPHGDYDNFSVVLAKDCEIAFVDNSTAVIIDGYVYRSWYVIITGVNSISANAKKNVYNVGYEFTVDDFQVFAFSINGQSGTIENFEISDVDTSTPGAKLVTITYTKDDSVLTAQCAVQVMNLGDTDNTIKTPNGNNPLYQQYFNAGNFNVSGWANIDGDINGNKIAEPSYANMIGKTFEGKNGEIVTGFNLDLVNGQYGENYYDLTIKNAKQFTTLGINCLVAYDDPSNPIKGFGCYINDDKSTLTWNSPAIVFIGSGQAAGNLPGTTYQVDDDTYNAWGANNAYALTTTSCANFQAGKTYTVHWVVVFEDGLSELCEWTVTMADLSESDAMFTDTEKPNANVIIMAGQSNMFGASPLTQTIIKKYAGYDFSNVFIKYNNINFDVVNSVTQNTLSTVFSNNGFEKYKLGIGGQSNNYFGPETALAAILSTTEGLKDQKWFIVKYAPAGTALSSQWTAGCQVNGKNTSLTDDMLEYVQAAIDELSGQYDVQVQSFMWMQGESDAINKTTAEGYTALEQNLVERVRNRFAAYATRKVGSIPGSGISFVNAGIAINDTDLLYSQGGPNDWVYAEIVNAGKISNSQWLCSIVGAGTDSALTTGPLKGYTFGKDKPTIPNPKQDGTIVNSIYIDTHHLLSKLNSTTEHPEYLDGDRTDWAHYGADSMDELGSLFASCLHYLMINDAGPVQQRVTFSADGGTVEGGNTQYAYVGEKITLPAATRDGYTFIGWYTQSTGGELIGNAGDEYVVNGSLTMYAQWTEVPKVQYTVTYNANSGSVSPSSATVNAGESVTLPTPTREGYRFNGWSDGTNTYDAGSNYTVDGNVTLTAQWLKLYTVTVEENGATVTLMNGNSFVEGEQVQYEVKFTHEYNQTCLVTDENGVSVTLTNSPGTTPITFNMPASNVTISASSEPKPDDGGDDSGGSCVTPDTLVTLADGTQKRVDEIIYEDKLLVWDFFKGEYAVVPSALIVNHGYGNQTIIKLTFSDGSFVKAITAHAFFDENTNDWELIDSENARDYIGHSFVKATDNGYTSVELVSVDIYEEYTESYSLVSAIHYNFITNDLFSLTNSVYDMLSGLVVGEDMKYDQTILAEDIAEYGLYTYADFEKYITFEQYMAFNGDYLKISVGKGNLTFEDILALIDTFL